MIKNKRGDIPVTILVIGVFAICGLAILSFMYSNIFVVKLDNLGIEIFEDIHTSVEQFYFYLNIGDSSEIASGNIGAKIIDNKLIIERSNEIVSVYYERKLR